VNNALMFLISIDDRFNVDIDARNFQVQGI